MGIGAEGPALRIALCEDMVFDTELLSMLIEMSKITYQLECFSSGEALLEDFEKDKYDLIFLDVYMGELTGVQTAERIRELDTQVVIIFTTTSDDFTREGYRLNAYKYLLKPVAQDDIFDALELATLKRDKTQGATLAIVTDNTPVVIPLSDIVSIESSNRRSLIYTITDAYATTMTIDDLEKLLPYPRFLRSHRSYIVNLDHVDVLADDFVMDNGATAYIAVKNHRKIKRIYEGYLSSLARSGE